MPNTKQEHDIIEKSPHYNTRKVEAITVIRHMDFATGCAFKYVWRHSLKDATTVEKGKRNYYIRDALIHRVGTMSEDTALRLTRVMSQVADEFDKEQFELLLALVWASAGEYDMLSDRAQRLSLFPSAVESLVLG